MYDQYVSKVFSASQSTEVVHECGTRVYLCKVENPTVTELYYCPACDLFFESLDDYWYDNEIIWEVEKPTMIYHEGHELRKILAEQINPTNIFQQFKKGSLTDAVGIYIVNLENFIKDKPDIVAEKHMDTSQGDWDKDYQNWRMYIVQINESPLELGLYLVHKKPEQEWPTKAKPNELPRDNSTLRISPMGHLLSSG